MQSVDSVVVVELPTVIALWKLGRGMVESEG